MLEEKISKIVERSSD